MGIQTATVAGSEWDGEAGSHSLNAVTGFCGCEWAPQLMAGFLIGLRQNNLGVIAASAIR